MFLSKHGIFGLIKWLNQNKIDLSLSQSEVWTVGPKTGEILKRELGLEAKIPALHSARGLIEAFTSLTPGPVILFCGKNTLPLFPNWLKDKGWTLYTVPVYRTDPIINQNFRLQFQNSSQECIFFTSPSSVEGFLASLGLNSLSTMNAQLASMGSTTSAAIQVNDGKIYFEAQEANIMESIDKLAAKLTGQSPISSRNIQPQKVSI